MPERRMQYANSGVIALWRSGDVRSAYADDGQRLRNTTPTSIHPCPAVMRSAITKSRGTKFSTRWAVRSGIIACGGGGLVSRLFHGAVDCCLVLHLAEEVT